MSKNYDYALALIENDVRNDCEYYVYSRLRDVVDGLENDNESLTKLLRDALEKKYSKEDELQAENAKLRELVQDLYCLAYPSVVELEVSDAIYDKYSPCEKCEEMHGGKSPCAGTAEDMTEECCAPIQASVIADRMRELGIEV